jgi:predicted ferric reductase
LSSVLSRAPYPRPRLDGAVGIFGSGRRNLDRDHPARRAFSRAAKSAMGWLIRLVLLGIGGAIIGVWAHAGGATGVTSLAALLTSAGRLTGLLGAYLLLLQVLSLARLPFFEWVAGFDRLTVLHRINGKLCLCLILAHVALITAGYALMSKISIPAQLLLFLTGYHAMMAALIGTVLLILVVATSVVIVKRRLRYESWYAVHLLAYAGVLLTWFHQIPTGVLVFSNPLVAAFWTGLYVFTLQLVIIFRFLQPAVRSWLHQLRVAEVVQEGEGVVSIRIAGRHLEYLNVKAGQFFQWRFLDRHRWWESHPFSLSEAPDGRSLRITIKDLGDFSRRARLIQPGTRVVAEGPFGSFTDAARVADRVALIAGGVGITPVRALLESMRGDIAVVYRATRYEDLIFRPELEKLASERGAQLHYLTGERSRPENRHFLTPQHLSRLIPDIGRRDVYLCGPSGMMEFIEESVRRVGVRESHIHRDDFAR